MAPGRSHVLDYKFFTTVRIKFWRERGRRSHVSSWEFFPTVPTSMREGAFLPRKSHKQWGILACPMPSVFLMILLEREEWREKGRGFLPRKFLKTTKGGEGWGAFSNITYTYALMFNTSLVYL